MEARLILITAIRTVRPISPEPQVNPHVLIDYSTPGPLSRRVLRSKTVDIDPMLVLKVWDMGDGSITVESLSHAPITPSGPINPNLFVVTTIIPDKEWKIECLDMCGRVIYNIGYGLI